MATELAVFNENATCPKCGGAEVGMIYHDGEYRYDCMLKYVYPNRGEHIERRCQRCHYTWAEACIEPPKGSKEEPHG